MLAQSGVRRVQREEVSTTATTAILLVDVISEICGPAMVGAGGVEGWRRRYSAARAMARMAVLTSANKAFILN
jgi:hypothetical protein